MADTMQFDLVSPERRLASFKASEVRIPGSEGDLTVMPGHTPVITTLRPGILVVVGPEGTQEYALTGGFAEISATGASILAERATLRAEANPAEIDALIEDAAKSAAAAQGSAKDAADKLLADLRELKAVLGH